MVNQLSGFNIALCSWYFSSSKACQGCCLGWSSTRSLTSEFRHRLWLPVQPFEQNSTGKIFGSYQWRLSVHVWEVFHPWMGISVSTQPSTYQLCGLVDRKPGSLKSRYAKLMFKSMKCFPKMLIKPEMNDGNKNLKSYEMSCQFTNVNIYHIIAVSGSLNIK